MTKKPNFIKPPNTLKEKVGEGGIPAHILKQCQNYIESNPVDFTPYGHRYLGQLKEIKGRVEKGDITRAAIDKDLVNVVMQLKSNGSMFHYQLISMTSDVMLRFLESVREINQDFLDILAVYTSVLEIILNKRLRGNGAAEGYALTQELHNACLRYYSKYDIKA